MMVTLNILLFPEFELYEVHMVMITSNQLGTNLQILLH